jgi:hypothetical protein
MSNDIAAALADLRKVVEENPNYAGKTNVGWFTTARPGNPFVKTQMDYEELREILGRSEVTDIAVAANWVHLDGTPASNEVPVEPRPTTGPFRRLPAEPSPYDDSAVGFGGFGGEHV